jgi:hypothetical protein
MQSVKPLRRILEVEMISHPYLFRIPYLGQQLYIIFAIFSVAALMAAAIISVITF